MKSLSKEDVTKISKDIAKILDDKKCEDISLIDLNGISAIADFFLIATADSTPKMNAVMDSIAKYFRKTKTKAINETGDTRDSVWLLIDYGFLVLHLFKPEGREYYELDKLWHEAKKIDF